MDVIVKKLSHPLSLVLMFAVFIVGLIIVSIGNSMKKAALMTPAPTNMPARPTSPVKKSGGPIDLDGTYRCNYASSSAVISKKRVYVETQVKNTSSYLIFSGDCLYSWTKNTARGVKKCGYGQYIDLYETFSGMGMVDETDAFKALFDSGLMESVLPGTASADLKKQGNPAEQFASSCREAASVDERLFQIPKTVKFAEQKQT